MHIGIVGLPNVGKSTLFNALTKKSVDAANYPFCTIDPSVGIVPVPDERLYKLAVLSHSQDTIPAVVEFVDIAGLVEGASQGEGLGNQFLSHIREVDAIAEVVRIFEDEHITHVHGKIDPMHDIEVINLELVLADMQVVSKRLGSVEKDIRAGHKDAIQEKTTLEKIATALEAGKMGSSVALTDEEHASIKHINLLTRKPMLYVLNTKAGAVNLHDSENARFDELMTFIQESGADYCIVDAGVEHEVKDLEGEEKELFRAELGVKESGLDTLIQKSYALLNLMTFFTTGEKETRAWTITRGSTAPRAGTAIHTDFKDKFIRAEVVAWDVLLEAGSYAHAREKGLIRTEGKEYIVQDGDVIEFKI